MSKATPHPAAAQQGFRVLRVWNNDMLARPTAVLDLICLNLEEQHP